MSSMLEQAIIDAAALREAALKNAERSLIEKYAPQIKEAVEAMLENDSSRRMKYENRVVSVVHESDSQGNVTVMEAGGKPFVVKESDLSEASEDELLQEEEMGMGGATASEGPANAAIEAPFAGTPQVQPDEMVNLSIDVDAMEDEIEIDLGRLERELEDTELTGNDMNSIGDMALDLGGEEDLLSGGDDLLGGDEDQGEEMGLGGGEEEDLQLQELLDILAEHEVDTLEEKVGPGGPKRAAKGGWIETSYDQVEEEDLYQQVADNLYEEEEEDEDENDETDETGIPIAQKQLEESINLLKTQNKELESIVYKLNDKLEETLLSNAKFLYQNRTLCDASLNERQKDKIVEAIAKAESPKEAKQLHETLRSTVGSSKKKSPKSLNETVNHKSNLSGMLNRRQNLNESKTADPFMKKMQKLAGIK
jgi:hypothetical protein